MTHYQPQEDRMSPEPKTPRRVDRLSAVEKRELVPDSLVGSFFHGIAEQGWQGCVVAEVHPGVYLVELFSWLAGDSTHQQLVQLEDMYGWQFYDTAKWMNNTYEYGGVQQRWDQERKRDTTDDAETNE